MSLLSYYSNSANANREIITIGLSFNTQSIENPLILVFLNDISRTSINPDSRYEPTQRLQ